MIVLGRIVRVDMWVRGSESLIGAVGGEGLPCLLSSLASLFQVRRESLGAATKEKVTTQGNYRTLTSVTKLLLLKTNRLSFLRLERQVCVSSVRTSSSVQVVLLENFQVFNMNSREMGNWGADG